MSKAKNDSLKRLGRFWRSLRDGHWHWYTPDEYSTCGAWPRWTFGIHFPPWGIGAVGEQWGIRILLLRWQLICHYPEANSSLEQKEPRK